MKLRPNKTVERINGTKSWFFEKINKTDKPLADLLRKKETQVNKIEMKEEKLQQIPRKCRRL